MVVGCKEVGVDGSKLHMSESGCARMTVNESVLEWVLAQFSTAPGKLIRYARHIDMKYTEKMDLMWAEY